MVGTNTTGPEFRRARRADRISDTVLAICMMKDRAILGRINPDGKAQPAYP
jgi:hypothetical protein